MASFFRSVLKGSGTISGTISGSISGSIVAIVLLGSVVSIEAARADGASSLNDIGGAAPSDPFSSRGDNSSGIMQMIHRVMQGDGNLDRAELRASQTENVNEATSDFFTKQRERLKAAAGVNPSANPGLPGTVVPAANPTANPTAPGVSSLAPQSAVTPLVITAPIVAPVAVPPVEATSPQAPVK